MIRRKSAFFKNFVHFWSAFLGALDGLLESPLADELVVSRQKHLWNIPTFITPRAGIDRGRHQSVLERVGEGGGLVAQGTRDEAHKAVDQNGSTQFATGKYIVAYAYLFGNQVFTDALVDAFVMAAEDDDVLFHGELVAQRLVEHLAVGTHVDDLVVVPLALQVADAVVDRLYHHDHACSSGKRVVVYLMVLVGAVVSQVVKPDFHNALVDGAFDDGFGEGSLKHFREDGDDVDAHKELVEICRKDRKKDNMEIPLGEWSGGVMLFTRRPLGFMSI